jgi:oligosaccharide repeat unit polymerase
VTPVFDLANTLLSLLLSVLIILTGYCASRWAKTWLVPGAIFSIFWFGYTFFPILFLYGMPINVYAMGYIFIAVFCFVLPTFLVTWRGALIANKRKVELGVRLEFHARFLSYAFYIVQMLVIVILVLDILAQGFTFGNIVFNLMETSSQYISMRYSDEIRLTLLARVGTVLMYVGVMLGGLIFCASRRRKSKLFTLFFCLFPSLIVMVVQGAKGALFLCAVFFYSTFLMYRLCSGNLSLTDKKINKNAAVAAMIIFPAIVSSFLSRGLYGYDIDYVIEKLFAYFASYAFAHLYAFSDWFSFYIGDLCLMDYQQVDGYYFGFYTFMSAFRLFGSTMVIPPGVFEEYFRYENLQTNIYTFFRGLVLDFGILGSFCFMFVLGLISTLSFYCLLRLHRPFLLISFFAVMAGFYYSSFIISVFIWNSIFFTFIIFAAILYGNNLIYVDKAKVPNIL